MECSNSTREVEIAVMLVDGKYNRSTLPPTHSTPHAKYEVLVLVFVVVLVFVFVFDVVLEALLLLSLLLMQPLSLFCVSAQLK